jgi:hypothetical protein
MNITKKRLNKIKKTKNQSKRYIHKNNKKNKKNKTIKVKRKAYNLKNKSFKILKKRKRKYKGGAEDGNKTTVIYPKLWTPLVDIEGEFELWTPLDDIKFPNSEIKEKINTSIIRGDDGTSKKEEEKYGENNEEEKVEGVNEFQKKTVETETHTNSVNTNNDNTNNDNTNSVKTNNDNTNSVNTDNTTKNSKEKKPGFFSRFSKNKPIKLKEYDETTHKKLMEVLKKHTDFKSLADAIKEKILNNNNSIINPEKINEFYLNIHYQLIKSNLFQTLASDYPKNKNKKEDANFDVNDAVKYIANKFHEKNDDKNIKEIIKLINDKTSDENGDENGNNGDGNKDISGGSNIQIGGGENKLKKWIEDLKKDLKDAELGAHLKEVVRLPKKNLLLTLNFVEDTKENNEKNENKHSKDILTTSRSKGITTQEVLDQLILELGDHIDEAKKYKDGKKI